METIVDMCNLLRGRKQQLIEVLDDFNYLCIEIADGKDTASSNH